MSTQKTFSICGMCTVRCPIQVETVHGEIKFIEGNPNAVFVVHGFGHTLPVESRALGRGLADNKFMKGGLDIWDPAGGAIAFQIHFVAVTPANKN